MKTQKINQSTTTNVRILSVLTLLFLSFGIVSQINAQTPAGLATGSLPTTSGPVATPQSGILMLNTSGTTYSSPNTAVAVTASVSNQQYVGSGTGTGNPVVMFGATNTPGGTTATTRPVAAAMNDIGTPANTQFSNRTDGTATGIDVATNQAINMYTSVHQWAGATTPAVNGRHYMGDLTLTFSTPLTNPLLQLVGLGGTSGSGLGFATELDLTTTGVTMSKVQGNAALVVSAASITNGNATGITASCSGGGAACGTVKLTGNRIQSVTFKLYIRGDGGAANWGSTTAHVGDQWLIGVSEPETYVLSGKVFNDTNGQSDNTVNGTGIGTIGAAQLYANLVEPVSGKVIGSVAVNSDGTFSFNGIPVGANVRIELSTNQGVALSASPAVALPSGWGNTGENIGTGAGSDGTPDGKTPATVNANVVNVNFGIRNLGPTAAAVSIGGQVLTNNGAGIRGVAITISDLNGNSRTVLTGSFGNYRFNNVAAGATYIVTATGKRYQFSQSSQVLNVTEDAGGVNFTAY